MGHYPSLYTSGQNGNQVHFVCVICLSSTGLGSSAWVSQHLGGQGGEGRGQSFQLQVSNAAAWPHPGHLASCP